MSAEEEGADEEAEKAFLQFYMNVPSGPSLSQVLQDPEKRRKLGELLCTWNMCVLGQKTAETESHL